MTTKQNNLAGSLLKGLSLLLSGTGVGWLIGSSVSEVIFAVITSLVALVVSVAGTLAGLNVEREEQPDAADAKPRRKVRVEVDPLPIMFMIIGLVVGSSLGIYGRTNGWLGPRPSNYIERWKVTGLSDKELSGRLFDELYPPKSPAKYSEEEPPKRSDGQPAPAGEPSDKSVQGGPASGSAKVDESNAGSRKGRGEGAAGSEAGQASSARKGEASAKASGDDLTRRTLTPALFSATDDECASFQAAPDDELQNLLTHLSGSSSEAEATRREAGACNNARCLRAIVARVCKGK